VSSTVTVLVVVVVVVVVYVLVFNPRNKDAFDSQSDMALRDEGDYKKSGDIK